MDLIAEASRRKPSSMVSACCTRTGADVLARRANPPSRVRSIAACIHFPALRAHFTRTVSGACSSAWMAISTSFDTHNNRGRRGRRPITPPRYHLRILRWTVGQQARPLSSSCGDHLRWSLLVTTRSTTLPIEGLLGVIAPHGRKNSALKRMSTCLPKAALRTADDASDGVGRAYPQASGGALYDNGRSSEAQPCARPRLSPQRLSNALKGRSSVAYRAASFLF